MFLALANRHLFARTSVFPMKKIAGVGWRPGHIGAPAIQHQIGSEVVEVLLDVIGSYHFGVAIHKEQVRKAGGLPKPVADGRAAEVAGHFTVFHYAFVQGFIFFFETGIRAVIKTQYFIRPARGVALLHQIGNEGADVKIENGNEYGDQ